MPHESLVQPLETHFLGRDDRYDGRARNRLRNAISNSNGRHRAQIRSTEGDWRDYVNAIYWVCHHEEEFAEWSVSHRWYGVPQDQQRTAGPGPDGRGQIRVFTKEQARAFIKRKAARGELAYDKGTTPF